MTQLQTIACSEIKHPRLIEGSSASQSALSSPGRAAPRASEARKFHKAAPVSYRTRIASGADALRASLSEIGPDAVSTPFQTATWINAWLDTIGKARNCDIHVAEIRDGRSGELMLVLPLVRRKHGLTTLIELPDFGLADYGGPVFKAAFRPDRAGMNRIWAQLIADLPSADILKINRLTKTSGSRDNPLMLLDGITRDEQSAWGTYLPEAPADFASLGLPKKRARELNKRFRRMAEFGPVEFRVASNPAEVDRFFQTMCRQRARRHAEMGRPDSLEHTDIRAFFHTMLQGGSDRAPARIQAVLVGNEIVATGYGLQSPQGFHVIFATLQDGIWRPLSPGLQYFRMSMAWASSSHEGGLYYDFTVGSEQYKAELGATETPLFELVQPLSPRGHAAIAFGRARRFIRSQPRLAHLLRCTARTLNLRSA